MIIGMVASGEKRAAGEGSQAGESLCRCHCGGNNDEVSWRKWMMFRCEGEAGIFDARLSPKILLETLTSEMCHIYRDFTVEKPFTIVTA